MLSTSTDVSERSIPASAGEPRQPSAGSRQSRVYPRECGGTSTSRGVTGQGKGLSPRVRGNQPPPPAPPPKRGSIPASAGEPTSCKAGSESQSVYPRECGGTVVQGMGPCSYVGLSPRVRGNLCRRAWESGCRRSIPASAGEPALVVGSVGAIAGLSPRVRGNPLCREY